MAEKGNLPWAIVSTVFKPHSSAFVSGCDTEHGDKYCLYFSVCHILKEQGVARHALTGIAPSAILQDVPELVKRYPSPSHVKQGAHDGTHHVAQETVGGNLEIPCGRGGLHPSGRRDMADGGLVVAPRLAESGVVLVREEEARSLVHSRKVERVVHLQGIMTLEGVFPGVYIIVVRARYGREAGVHAVGHRKNVMDRDVAGQDAIQAIHHLVARERKPVRTIRSRLWRSTLPVEVRRHLACMNPRVGAPCADHLDVFSQQNRQATLQLLLHRVGIGLNLPAMIVGAIIAKGNKVSTHGRKGTKKL